MTLVTSNDDGGVGLNSRAIFTPAASGTYDFAVSGLGGGTGTYELHVNEDDLRNTVDGDGDAGAVGNRLPGQFANDQLRRRRRHLLDAAGRRI